MTIDPAWRRFLDFTLLQIGLDSQRAFTALNGGKKPKHPPRNPTVARAFRVAKRCMLNGASVPAVQIVGQNIRFEWYYPDVFEFLVIDDKRAEWQLYRKAQPLAKAEFTPDQRQDNDDDCAGCRYGG